MNLPTFDIEKFENLLKQFKELYDNFQEPPKEVDENHPYGGLDVEPPKEKECKHEWGGVYPSNEMKCMKCGKDYSKPELNVEVQQDPSILNSKELIVKPEVNTVYVLRGEERHVFRLPN